MIVTSENYFNMLTMAEYLALCLFYAFRQEKRDHFILRFSSFSLLSLGLSFLTAFINFNEPISSLAVNYILIVFFGIMSLYFSFKMSFGSAMFYGVLSYNLRHLIYLVWQLLIYILQDATGRSVDNYGIWIGFALLSCLVLSPLVIYLYFKIKNYPDISLQRKTILLYSLFCLLINIALNCFVINTDFDALNHSLFYVLNIFNILGCVMLFIIMFGFVSQKALEKEVASINQMRHEEEKQYEVTKETIDLINIKCHDLRHQIRELSKKGDGIQKEELQSIEEAIHIYDTRIQTGNKSLDVILQEKSLICSTKQIVFNCIIDGESLSFMKESEIYSLFGNIVDNAIESTSKIENKAERVITLKIKKVANGVFAYEENRYDGDLAFKDGLPVSTKGDDRYHGFGMKSIKMIVDHYKGTLKIKAENGLFSISIFFEGR